jgi:hypothetical protein
LRDAQPGCFYPCVLALAVVEEKRFSFVGQSLNISLEARVHEFGRVHYLLVVRRSVVKRCVNRLQKWRAIATRYKKQDVNYRAAVVIAALMIWLA